MFIFLLDLFIDVDYFFIVVCKWCVSEVDLMECNGIKFLLFVFVYRCFISVLFMIFKVF